MPVNNRGAVHLHLTGIILIGIVTYLLVNSFQHRAPREKPQPAPAARQYLIETEGEMALPIYGIPDTAASLLDNIVDIQIRLLRVKATAIKIAWADMSEKERRQLISQIETSMRKREQDISRFLSMYESRRWSLLTKEEQLEAINSLLQSINKEQLNIINLLDKLSVEAKR